MVIILTDAELVKFLTHIEVDGDCWVSTLPHRQKFGYHYLYLPSAKRIELAHRISWALTYGQIPAGLCVLHRCDNPRCVRPDHLFLGTRGDNSLDALAKGRFPATWRGARSRLTRDDVREMRRRSANGETRRALAADYDTTPGNVGLIVTRQSWRDIPD